jgi:hypothetical protein
VTIRKAGRFLVDESSVRDLNAGDTVDCGGSSAQKGIRIIYEIED